MLPLTESRIKSRSSIGVTFSVVTTLHERKISWKKRTEISICVHIDKGDWSGRQNWVSEETSYRHVIRSLKSERNEQREEGCVGGLH